MADSTIGSLPTASELDDTSLLVTEQRGIAMRLTGLLLKQYVRNAVQSTALYTKDGSTETLFTKGILGLGLKLDETTKTLYVETFDQTAASDDDKKPVSYKDFKTAIGDIETALADI